VKLVAACAVALALAAPASAAVVATAAQNGKTVRLKRGEILAIVLDSNPSTGSSWKLVGRTGPVLSAPGQGLVAPKAQGMVGVPGVAVFTFQATQPGRTAVRLAYIGPDRKVVQRYTLNVVVHA
jgi:inhibitor of cysteine peptidase